MYQLADGFLLPPTTQRAARLQIFSINNAMHAVIRLGSFSSRMQIIQLFIYATVFIHLATKETWAPTAGYYNHHLSKKSTSRALLRWNADITKNHLTPNFFFWKNTKILCSQRYAEFNQSVNLKSIWWHIFYPSVYVMYTSQQLKLCSPGLCSKRVWPCNLNKEMWREGLDPILRWRIFTGSNIKARIMT